MFEENYLQDIITVLIFGSLIIFFLLKKFEKKSIIYGVTTKTDIIKLSLFDFYYFLLLILNTSIFISFFKKEAFRLNETAFIAICLLVFIFGQSLIQLVIAWTFNFVKLISYYLKQKMILANGFLIFIFLINISITYTQDNLHMFLSIGLIFITSYSIFSFLKILSKHKKIISENLFYFILYLCTLEIIPLFTFYKLLMGEIQS
tara:strand:- start:361 stop:972 length:612 start_codon:yes stop_codon:yes gene_type:complete